MPGGAAQQEDVVERAVRTVEGRIVVVEAVNREIVDAVGRPAGVEHVDDIVTHVALRAGGVDHVGVGTRLPVEHQRVACLDAAAAVSWLMPSTATG